MLFGRLKSQKLAVSSRALQCRKSAQHASHMAEAEARRHGGAIAFSRTGDPSSGDFEGVVVLGQFGLGPEEVG